MDRQVKQRERDGIIILDVKGRLVLRAEDLSILHRLLFLLDRKRRNVIVNLTKVSEIDAAGLDMLVSSARRFQESGRKLAVLRRDGKLKSRDHGEMYSGLESYREESEAVNSFFPERAVPRYDILEFVKEQQLR